MHSAGWLLRVKVCSDMGFQVSESFHRLCSKAFHEKPTGEKSDHVGPLLCLALIVGRLLEKPYEIPSILFMRPHGHGMRCASLAWPSHPEDRLQLI